LSHTPIQRIFFGFSLAPAIGGAVGAGSGSGYAVSRRIIAVLAGLGLGFR